MLTWPRASAILADNGITPKTVLAYGATEDGYLSLERHQDATIVTSTGDGPDVYQVPWPSREVWFAFRMALGIDNAMNGSSPNPNLADGIEAAADWLDARRDQTWNGGQRRPSNFGRAAAELRIYAAEQREAARG